MGTAIIWFGKSVIFIMMMFSILRTIRPESNMAINKPANQSSGTHHTWVASKVVDGCVKTDIGANCCTHTNATGPKTVWWQVDLSQPTTINSISIYHRAGYGARFAGYHLYVSNTTDIPPDRILCYEDKSSTNASVQLMITHQCPYVGRYVTVYNYRNTTKRYSWYDNYAVLELCEVQVWGCPVGTYGDGNCNSACSENCNGGNCNATTGDCFYCFPGRWGNKCESSCSTNCVRVMCDRYTGRCTDCITGRYGDTCDQICSNNCKGNVCEMNSGHCFDCVSGTYGIMCEHSCSSNCNAMLCDRTSAHCADCISGWYGDRCNQRCSLNCSGTSCERTTGNCFECAIGKHGVSCDQDCPVNCRDGCTRNNATCIGCQNGRYGVTCSSTCPVTCKDFVCDQQTGHCLDCYPGKYGVVCGADCPDSCTDNNCNKEDGQCLTQVDPNIIIIAVLAVVCGLLIVAWIITYVYRRRNRDSIKNSSDKATEQSGPDTGYSSIDRRDVEPAHVYEMVVT